MSTVRDNVVLNDTERELFNTLLEATQHAGTGTVLRCAGGWVRDKLLGKDSLDIDIALDNMLGKDFADKVNEFLLSKGREVRNAAVIQSNPDQSKHLETARMKINNIWIDLVNLRSETYAQDSRIPQMEFGTPEQDAYRRDFTINSLFYNINQGCVEDLTGRGLADLRAGLMRTPLPPLETFLDDPLRVLRAVRFGTRFGFELDAALTAAAASEQVRMALAQKISRERVGTELEGMFNGPNPLASVKLLLQLSLFPVVFAPPANAQSLLDANFSEHCVECMAAAEAIRVSQGVTLDNEERRYFLLAALLLPLRQCTTIAAKGKPAPVSTHIVRESLKWRAKDGEMTVLLHEVAPELLSIAHQLSASGEASSAPDSLKVTMGNIIRKLKQHWRLGFMLAPVLTSRHAAPLGVDSASSAGDDTMSEDSSSQDAEAASIKRSDMAASLLAAAEAFGLQDCWQWKALMDGKQVMSTLGLQKAGPELGKIMAAAMDWQLVHPHGTLDECKQYVQAWWETHKSK